MKILRFEFTYMLYKQSYSTYMFSYAYILIYIKGTFHSYNIFYIIIFHIYDMTPLKFYCLLWCVGLCLRKHSFLQNKFILYTNIL